MLRIKDSNLELLIQSQTIYHLSNPEKSFFLTKILVEDNGNAPFSLRCKRSVMPFIRIPQKWRGLCFARIPTTPLFLSMPPRNIECIPFNLIYRWCYPNGKVFAPTDELAECACKSPRWLARQGSNLRPND